MSLPLANVNNGMAALNLNGFERKSSDPEPFVKGAEVRVTMPWGYIAGKAWGCPTGLPILGLHGWMDNAGTFDKLAPLLSKSLYFVAIELPGHGLSSHLPAGIPYHFVDYVLVIRRVVQHFKWKKFSIIGHSMGAGLGALYSSLYPTEIDHLVLLDLAKPLTGDTNNYATKISLAVDAFLTLEEKITPVPPSYTYDEALERLIQATDGGLTEEAAKILMVRGTRQVDENKWSFTRDLRLRSPTIQRLGHDDAYRILNDIRCPLLLIKAKQSRDYEAKAVIEAAIEIYKKKCSSFQYCEVQGNHFVHINDAPIVVDIINRFFSEQKACL